MRLRHLLTTLAAVPLLAVLAAAPASAGTGPSASCHDGTGWQEVQILSSPVSVGVEVYTYPATGYQIVLVCYSTTPAGTPGGIAGGFVALGVATETGTAYPGAYAVLQCVPDAGTGIGPVCNLPSYVRVAPGDVAVTTPPGSICVVSVGSGCVAYVPGVKVATGGDAADQTVGLVVLGTGLPVDLPAQCVAVLVTCP
jgi:hypothetical protein